MTDTHNRPRFQRRTWPDQPQVFETPHAASQVHRSSSPDLGRAPGNGVDPPPADIIAHLVMALSGYLRQLRTDRRRVPGQLVDLTAFLAARARPCQEVPLLDRARAGSDPPAVPRRLLITKAEAAEQLGVSLRTIERLISAGRLPLVHVEGAARVRVADLEAYVQGLDADHRNNSSPAEQRSLDIAERLRRGAGRSEPNRRRST